MKILRFNCFCTSLSFQEPQYLIRVKQSQNTSARVTTVMNQLDQCNFQKLYQYLNLINYVMHSHMNGFIAITEIERKIASTFSHNYINSHMLWISYILSKTQNWGLLLRNLESTWYQNSITYNTRQIECILLFYKMINSKLMENTAQELLNKLNKLYNEEDAPQIFSCLQLLIQQYPILKGDETYLKLINKVQSIIDRMISKKQLIQNLKLYQMTNINLEQINELLSQQMRQSKLQLTVGQMSSILSLIGNQNYQSNNNKEALQSLNSIYSILNSIKPPNLTKSILFQMQILKNLQNHEIIQESYKEQLALNNIKSLLNFNAIMNEEQQDSNYNFISQYFHHKLQDPKYFTQIFCEDAYEFSEINEVFKKQQYKDLQQKYYEYLRQFQYLF